MDHAPLPSQVALGLIMAERAELYRSIPPVGENIPTSMTPDHIDDSVPTEEEVE